MRIGHLAWFVGFLALGSADIVNAQSVRGVVTDGMAPVPGVVVILLDGSGKEAVRAFTNEQGEYRITAPRAGEYRVRTLRIGFRPQVSDPVTVGAGDAVDRPVVLTSVPTGLDTMRAVGRSACRLSPGDSALATWRLWEQVRAALAVTQLTRSNRGSRRVSATTVSFVKTLEPVRRQVQEQEYDVRSDFVAQPWRAATPAELHRLGYVITEGNGATTYHAPSLEALLADEFLEDHCMRVVTTRDPAVIGVAFEPNRDRRDIPGIRGTVWVVRATSELRSLDYRYENAGKDVEGFGGGEMEFVRMKNGAWAISSWSIRMPSLALGPQAHPGDLPSVESIRVVGGMLALVTAGDEKTRDTLWARPPLTLSGTVADSSGAPLKGGTIELAGTALRASTDAGGRFTFVGILPGIYTIKVRAANDTTPIFQAPFKFADTSAAVSVRVPRRAIIASSSAVVASQAQGLANFSGAVLDSAGNPLADAEVTLPALGFSARSDARGEFSLAGIIPGTHQVIVRRVGYGVMATRLVFDARQTVERRVVLTRLTVLDSVLTRAVADNDPLMAAFEEHKRRGFGVFMARAQLDKHESQTLSTVAQQISGLRFIRGKRSQLWVMGSRAPASQCRHKGTTGETQSLWAIDTACVRRERRLYVPDETEAMDGAEIACYAEV
ncbi:MAG: carboxypeptidase regulatory-like domain-containing protein, partial [Gemmatimonadaceae bacterium]